MREVVEFGGKKSVEPMAMPLSITATPMPVPTGLPRRNGAHRKGRHVQHRGYLAVSGNISDLGIMREPGQRLDRNRGRNAFYAAEFQFPLATVPFDELIIILIR